MQHKNKDKITTVTIILTMVTLNAAAVVPTIKFTFDEVSL